jgi:hypothetical protein
MWVSRLDRAEKMGLMAVRTGKVGELKGGPARRAPVLTDCKKEVLAFDERSKQGFPNKKTSRASTRRPADKACGPGRQSNKHQALVLVLPPENLVCLGEISRPTWSRRGPSKQVRKDRRPSGEVEDPHGWDCFRGARSENPGKKLVKTYEVQSRSR